jgi:hypothetical protein
MKGGFQDLTDIPDDQLSKDRLRNAILMQGLKPQPEKASPLGWLWMPATAFLLAAGLMLFNPRGGSDPVVAVGEKDLPGETIVLKEPSGFKLEPAPKKSNTSKRTLLATNDAPKRVIRQNRVRQEEEFAEVELQPFESSINGEEIPWNDGGMRPPTPSVDETEASQPVAHAAPATSTPIVIIEENRDESTGAYRATEVGTASNVLIGG